ncbi:hypothetical protein BH09ACT12_BH09ACT12_16570 [soil metagenome]
MRSRRPSQEHADAVARRLAELSAQLAASRDHGLAGSGPGTMGTAGDEPQLAPAVGDEWWADHTRIAQRPPLSVVPPAADAGDAWAVEPAPPPRLPQAPAREPQQLPNPGRHAARRPLAWASEVVPASLQGRVRLGSPQVAAVAVLVALGLALTCWWVVRGDPESPVPVAIETAPGADGGALVVPPGDGAPTGEPAAPVVPTAAGDGPVTVDVAGKVRHPGIVVLDAGSRVVDALEQAGGARPQVDLTSLNLARLLVDGEQIVVGVDGAVAAPQVPPASGGTSPQPTALVDLNLADQTLLETLPQVGPVTASAIIAWRTEHGGFTAITELLEVDGIGETTLAQLTPYVTV